MAKQRLSKLQRLILKTLIEYKETDPKWIPYWYCLREQVSIQYAGIKSISKSFNVSFCRSIFNLYDKGFIDIKYFSDDKVGGRYEGWGSAYKHIDITEKGLMLINPAAGQVNNKEVILKC